MSTRVESSGFSGMLGVTIGNVSSEQASLAIEFSEALSNGDTALHGGVMASAITTAASAVARAALGADAGPFHCAAVQVAYLSAALNEGIVADARVLRRGKELAYVDVDVASRSGKAVAKGLVTVRGRAGGEIVVAPAGATDAGAADPGPMGEFIGRLPFHAGLGLNVEHMAGGMARIVLPWRDTNAGLDGGVDDGAVLALLDTTGAMAAWAETGPGAFKASTAVMQAHVLAPAPAEDLVASGRVRHRDHEAFFCDVEITAAGDGRLVALGAVNYRIAGTTGSAPAR